ncbi:putative RNA polymerase III RPC4 [Monocercomonoides exilis]|uniref:putative RNA polymerase III RPC4 n=1 Tax=Monocercomonoides exilis TaxID=2049356 RepID=UPI0035593758|nr:putative RNA polymerase III RPC4 [Monocercomonoides exilis]|eukprot:MONOS_4181.1-p1 / transcript=MONOS_4181.1 / gene=MONOS_4181 / organism=Monocercomonoides_exilis_PA203 / gene_product=unspecified product / transcript_product=unspecified product / location=Mono_scaffold00107:92140-93332(-) / protein_length=322 / sequence_SO=supercontig / SO=protein_coding / is_pseudo=false
MQGERLDSLAAPPPDNKKNPVKSEGEPLLVQLLSAHGPEKPRHYRPPRPKRETPRSFARAMDSQVAFMATSRISKRMASNATAFVGDPLGSIMPESKEEKVNIQALPLSFPLTSEDPIAKDASEISIAIPEEQPFLIQMPATLPFLNPSESKEQKESFLQRRLSAIPTSLPPPATSGTPKPSTPIPSQTPPLSRPPSVTFPLASTPPLVPSQRALTPQVQQQQQQQQQQQAQAPVIMIPDTLPPTPIIGIPSGVVGKLKITKSGKAFMDFGGTKFLVNKGIDCSCYQQIVSIDHPNKKITKISEIKDKFVVVPDIEGIIDTC